MLLRNLICIIWMLLVGTTTGLHAALNIEIYGGGGSKIPIALVPFVAEAQLPERVSAVVAADLERSGLFKLVDTFGASPHELDQVNYADWQNRNAAALVIGSISTQPDGRLDVRFRLLDVAKRIQLAGFSSIVTTDQLRALSHRI